MASIINADTSNGLKLTSDTTGQLDFQSAGSTKATIDTAGNLKFDSGYGSVATAYGCRAWVNFNGTGTVAIRASGNVSSITDNGTGNYTMNMTTALVDADYSITGFTTGNSTDNLRTISLAGVAGTGATTKTTTACNVVTGSTATTSKVDMADISLAVFR
jgi:hypothetical protein